MTIQGPPETDRPIPLLDFWRLLCKRRWRIFSAGVAGAMLLGYFAASRPIRYDAQATFREKSGEASSAGSGGMLSLLAGALNRSDDSTVPTLKSRRLWKPLVERHQLHVQLKERVSDNPLLKKLRDNWESERAWWNKVNRPILANQSEALICENVCFSREFPIALHLQFVDSERYTLQDADGVVREGRLGDPFESEFYSFTLLSNDTSPLQGREFSLSLQPVHLTAENLGKRLTAKPIEKSASVLELTFSHEDRLLASQLLNELMVEYRSLLELENQELATRQLNYLNKRQLDVTQDLEELIFSYANNLSEDLPNSGIVDSQLELEALSKQKEQWNSKRLSIDLELQRLSRAAQNPNASYFETLGAVSSLPPLVQETITEITRLKQQRDRLELALHKHEETLDRELIDSFQGHMQQLVTIEQRLSQTKTLKQVLQQPGALPQPEALFNEQQGYLSLWYRSLYEDQLATQADLQAKFVRSRAHFLDYLNNLDRLSLVHKRLLEERMAHQQNPSDELLGADTNAVNKIYVRLNEQLDQVQVNLRENAHLQEQLANPLFEASTLSGKLQDPVSERVIGHYSDINMRLKATEVHGERDRERLTQELDQQRQFLRTHLKQVGDLLKLQQDFLNEKIWTVLQAMLDLVQQQVSLSSRHLDDYLNAHIDQLKGERELIVQTVREINQEMARLPQKWAAEQIIKQQSLTGSKVVEEVSRLVETKNIGHNIDIVQSGPLDVSTPPLLPHPPLILLYTVAGGVLGILFGVGTTFVQGLWQGLPVSKNSLLLAGQAVMGDLPRRKDRKRYDPDSRPEQKEAIRRLLATLCPPQTRGSIGLILGAGVDYTSNMAKLLHARGEHILRIVLDDTEEELPSLTQLLDNAFHPEKLDGYDQWRLGGDVSYLTETLASTKFKKWLQHQLQRYDRVLLVTHETATSPVAHQLAEEATSLAITTENETLSELDVFCHQATDGTRIAYFVCD